MATATATKKAPPKAAPIKIRPINLKRITFRIVGTSPLIQHAWSEKALRELRMSKAERALDKKQNPPGPRDSEMEAEAATHRLDDGGYGIPAVSIKAAIISAAHKDLGIEKTAVRKSLFIMADDAEGLVRMHVDEEPFIREDIVRVGMGSTDIRYRPQFNEWSVAITATIDADILSKEVLVNLVNRAGFGCGVGEWRPERGGDFGRFELDTSTPIEQTSIDMKDAR